MQQDDGDVQQEGWGRLRQSDFKCRGRQFYQHRNTGGERDIFIISVYYKLLRLPPILIWPDTAFPAGFQFLFCFFNLLNFSD